MAKRKKRRKHTTLRVAAFGYGPPGWTAQSPGNCLSPGQFGSMSTEGGSMTTTGGGGTGGNVSG